MAACVLGLRGWGAKLHLSSSPVVLSLLLHFTPLSLLLVQLLYNRLQYTAAPCQVLHLIGNNITRAGLLQVRDLEARLLAEREEKAALLEEKQAVQARLMKLREAGTVRVSQGLLGKSAEALCCQHVAGEHRQVLLQL